MRGVQEGKKDMIIPIKADGNVSNHHAQHDLAQQGLNLAALGLKQGFNELSNYEL